MAKLWVFYVSCFCAFLAGHMVNYSAIMYSLEAFDSSMLAGLAYGFCFGPPVIFGWVAGAYIDRYSAKKVLLLAQNFFIAGALGMMFVMLFEPVYSIILLLCSSFFIGISWAFVAPSRLASLGQYVEVEQLPQATIVFNLLVMIGFGLAPILLTVIQEFVGWYGVAMCSAILFVISSLLILPAPSHHQRLTHQHLYDEWSDCFGQIKQNPVIAQLLFAAIIGYMLMGPMQVVLPQVAEGMLGLNTLQKGQYLGLISLALLMGGIIAMKVKDHINIGKSIVVMLVLCGLCISLIGSIHTVWLSCVVLLIGTTLAGVIVSLIVAGLQFFTPQNIRGRVMSIYTIISQVISAMAGVFAGALAQEVSVPMSLYTVGAVFVVLALLLGLKGVALSKFKTFKV
jgi:MFS family permease